MFEQDQIASIVTTSVRNKEHKYHGATPSMGLLSLIRREIRLTGADTAFVPVGGAAADKEIQKNIDDLELKISAHVLKLIVTKMSGTSQTKISVTINVNEIQMGKGMQKCCPKHERCLYEYDNLMQITNLSGKIIGIRVLDDT